MAVCMESECGLIRPISFTGIDSPMSRSLAALILCLCAGCAWSNVWGQKERRLHMDEVTIQGRFLYEWVDPVDSLADPGMVLFEGVLFDLWPNGKLKSECGVTEGQWDMDCLEWHQNGQLRSEESIDPPHYYWNGWHSNGAVFFRKTYQFDGPAGAFIGVGEELKSECFDPHGARMPCPEEFVWPEDKD